MTERKYIINADMSFYKQEYCGCSFSLRDVNAYRRSQGQSPIRIPSNEIYNDPAKDNAEESLEAVESFFQFDTERIEALEEKRKSRLETMYSNRDKGENKSNW